jgi:hypothetical protein
MDSKKVIRSQISGYRRQNSNILENIFAVIEINFPATNLKSVTRNLLSEKTFLTLIKNK